MVYQENLQLKATFVLKTQWQMAIANMAGIITGKCSPENAKNGDELSGDNSQVNCS